MLGGHVPECGHQLGPIILAWLNGNGGNTGVQCLPLAIGESAANGLQGLHLLPLNHYHTLLSQGGSTVIKGRGQQKNH